MLLSRKGVQTRTNFWVAALIFLLALSLLVINIAGTSASENTIYGVRLSQESWAEADNLNPIAVIDYGSFVWLELAEDDFAGLEAQNLSPEQVMAGYSLILGERRFDGKQQSPTLPAGWDNISSDQPDLHLVQFHGPTKDEWLTALEANSLQVVQYLHPFGYIVWGENVSDVVAADAQLSNLVRWSGPYYPAYRVLPAYRSNSSEMTAVHILMYRGADTEQVIQDIVALGVESTGSAVLNKTWEIAGFNMPANLYQTAASIPGVYSIQPVHDDGGLRGEMSNQINVGNYDGTNAAFPGYAAWLTAAGVDGDGVVMANVDGGVQETHPDLVNNMVNCTGTTCSGISSTHGTHTAGIMAGDGASGTTSNGFLRGQGVAPGATLFEQRYSPFYTQPGGMLLLMTDSFNNGASLSGNSWGPSGSPQGYDDDTLQVDIGVRDADPGEPGNQPLTYVLSFMNGNGGTSSQGTPDEAKNIFNIGSTKMQTGGGAQILQIDDLSANSAHGPALDGRTIPHLVAPGCSVDSTVTSNGYGLLCGTSMASPHVSGAVALFIEYYRNLPLTFRNGPADPSPALIKAAFLPVAHDLDGHDDADGNTLGHPFDNKQGWGRMDLSAVVSPTVTVRYFDNPVLFDNTAEEWNQTINPADPSQPIKIMLVWTDAPGHGNGGSAPAWNNDLDLFVMVGTDTYVGNNFGSDGWSQIGPPADEKNNTEGVFLGPTPPMTATISVKAANITSDGVPNVGDTTDQDFALVCYNCTLGTDVATLVRSEDTIEETVTMGDVVTRTLVVSNTGTTSFNFTVSESEDWVSVTPSGGTIGAGSSMELGVVFDSNETAGAGDYSTNLSFSGNYDNSPADVSLVLHVEEGGYETYLPSIHGDGGAAAPQANLNLFILPLVGFVLTGAGWISRKRGQTK